MDAAVSRGNSIEEEKGLAEDLRKKVERKRLNKAMKR